MSKLAAHIVTGSDRTKGTYKQQTENWKNQYFELQAKYSDLSKQLKAKQAELDTSVTAQNALKSDLDKLAAELRKQHGTTLEMQEESLN